MAKKLPKCYQIAKLFCCDNLWKNIIMALEILENSGNFFLLLCGHPKEGMDGRDGEGRGMERIMPHFKAKMHQTRFRLGLRPRPRWGTLQRSPEPLAGFRLRIAARLPARPLFVPTDYFRLKSCGGGSGPPSNVPCAHWSLQPKRHLDRFSRFCRAHYSLVWQADRPRYSVGNNRSHLRT